MAKKNTLLVPKKSAKPSLALHRPSKSTPAKARGKGKAPPTHEVIHIQQKTNFRTLQNITPKLVQAPGELELHTTKSAPSEQQIREQIIRNNELERVKYFGVPIKIYEKGEQEGTQGDSRPGTALTDEDRSELQLYGSRVVMDEEGRVLGLEVRKDLEHFTKGNIKTVDYCECIDMQYEVSKKLEKLQGTRRCFMAKVLFIEALIRLPALPFLYGQHHLTSVFNFTYTQPVFMMAICLLLFGSRIVSITCTKVGRYEPCRSVMLFITALSYAVNCATFNSAALKYAIRDLNYNEFEDPISLEALKQKAIDYPAVSFPYVLMNEFKNTFLLIILLIAPGLAYGTHRTIDELGVVENTWHQMQQLVGLVCGCKWAMFRFYALQRVTKGRVMPVDETMYSFVALMFATSW